MPTISFWGDEPRDRVDSEDKMALGLRPTWCPALSKLLWSSQSEQVPLKKLPASGQGATQRPGECGHRVWLSGRRPHRQQPDTHTVLQLLGEGTILISSKANPLGRRRESRRHFRERRILPLRKNFLVSPTISILTV